MNIIDTKQIQIDCLTTFMKHLFFTPVDETNLGRGFKYMDMTSWEMEKYISFADACKLYNGNCVRLHKRSSVSLGLNNPRINIHPLRLGVAWNAKLIEQVRLQRDKKQSDGVKCQGHRVKFTLKGEDELKEVFYGN